ncbi:hypothetical protein F5890DRAFT_1572633 [Lentinula detonsa]|uniref:Uncharacterized protein n=1 Tax=Lentinula detonsa TaxID=2804962 RepID=A0AA38Q1W8_9AGAR|nr:hypothetical protein F5890DRAFT_1572633 [Lentinula detonsa]
MPGPSNGRKKRKSGGKTQRKKFTVNVTHQISHNTITNASIYDATDEHNQPHQNHQFNPHLLLQEPYIHDPGNGPRVRNTRAFLKSRYFSQPPALDDPLCAEFAQEEVLQMLKTVLPEELALILWYNKSRASSRICPACQRLYHVGEVLPDHATLTGGAKSDIKPLQPPELEREQELSGFSSFNQCDPRTTKAAWGHTADEIDDGSWTILNGGSPLILKEGPGQNVAKALVMIVRMTRLDDLGLAQLCFPDVNWEVSNGSKEDLDVIRHFA